MSIHTQSAVAGERVPIARSVTGSTEELRIMRERVPCNKQDARGGVER